MNSLKRRRCPIAESEKRALRNYYYVTSHRKASSDSCRLWFFEQYGHALSPSSISTILKDTRYAYLDDDTSGRGRKRRTPAAWLGLETALYSWQRRMERKMLAITGDVLRATAAKLWSQLPQFRDISMPKWSSGWLCNFKRRCGIKQHTKHGEAASVNTEEVKSQLDILYEKLLP